MTTARTGSHWQTCLMRMWRCVILGRGVEKARLLAEIVNHESTHGRCTKTFIKKVRKQTRPAAE